jgi:distribution and morphology protein 12
MNALSQQHMRGPPLPGHSNRIPNLHESAVPRSSSPGIPGGTSNFSYFHLPMGGLPGTQTPLAAVASGTPLSPIGWHHDFPHSSLAPYAGPSHPINGPQHDHRDPSTRPSTANTIPSSPDLGSPPNPASPERMSSAYSMAEKVRDDPNAELQGSTPSLKEPLAQPSDMQVVARVQYSGDIRMTLTAEILLDYPMPSFVGIPLKLSITGMSFDGVAILAYIKKRMNFCFLDPEDAQTLVGDHVTQDSRPAAGRKDSNNASLVGLLKEIHIESEIGRQEDGKQVLKNVGKVEKFVLEQIRRIFEDEFVFPSFWTFLV